MKDIKKALGYFLVFFLFMSSTAFAMKYHNNDIYFAFSLSPFELVEGNFEVTDFSVTKGQDPNGKIYQGLKKSFEGNGKMTFEVGRKGSQDVADWFMSKIPPSKTTFNHKPGKLNFAFIGNLSLELTGGILGDGSETYYFENIGIAQGHSFAANNWWFGGSDSQHVSQNKILCTGRDSKGSKVMFLFMRGNNKVDTIQVIPTSLISTVDWMNNLSDSAMLDSVMMPGTHDAGMSETHHCHVLAGMETGYVRTQSLPVFGQLMGGSRYFDVRVDYDHDQLVTYHRTGKIGCNGQPLKDVFNETVDFLKKYKSETAILKISHIREDRGDKEKIKKKIEAMVSTYYEPYIYKNFDSSINLTKIPIKELRGKIVVVFDYSDFIDTSAGRFRYIDGYKSGKCYIFSPANLTVCDSYSNTSSFYEMKADQLTKWNNCGAFGKGRLFLLSWTLTAKTPIKDPTIPVLAKKANTELPYVLFDQIALKKNTKPNIVYIDFLDSLTAQAIISYNFM